VYAVGSSSDRRLGIPGEELGGCHSATAFVGWYNAHPDFRDFPFDLGVSRAVVVGVGNVAMDIARLLLKSPDELAKTDIAQHAMEALRASRVREVVLLARRGPAQAAFDARELEDIASLAGVGVHVDLAAVEADARGELDVRQKKNIELMLELARGERKTTERVLRLEFNASPTELLGDERRCVRAVRVERNELVRGADGRSVAKGTGRFFEVDAGIVFRSIGYLGLPLPGVPFDDKAGIIPNRDGRVTNGPGGELLGGTYAVGWIRRGALGVIGTNKADAQAVSTLMIEDVPTLTPAATELRSHDAIDALVSSRGIRVTTYADWSVIDALEVDGGRVAGKVREKFASVDQMMNELLRSGTARE
jgi:ferredoxin--NADP+ reductase